MARETLVTKDGYQKLAEELEHLTTVRRREVAERIRNARDFGDISENAEYDDAKNEQARLEARILELEERLRTAKVIERVSSKVVGIGSAVRVRDLDRDELLTYTVVGPTEVDLVEMKISHESPIGSALMGLKKGDECEIEVPSGVLRYRVTSVLGRK